jgi:peptidyl-prolyl cis-trans isomerase A (cyclophilin A)
MRIRFCALLTAVLVMGCGGENATGEAEPVAPAPPVPAAAKVWKLAEDAHPGLTNPSKALETAPDTFKVKLETTQGDVIVQIHRAWSPAGADRFYNLVRIGFFEDVAFFRAVDKFMVQFGVSGYPEVAAVWRHETFKDEPVKQSNTRGRLAFAKTDTPHSRTTQIFITLNDNAFLDEAGFAPFGEVVAGMAFIDTLYTGYGEGPPLGRGPNPSKVQMVGNVYLKRDFPNLDYIKAASLIP